MSDHDAEASPEVESMNGSFSTNGNDPGAIASALDDAGSGQDLSFLDDLAKAMRSTAAAEQARDAELTEQRRQAHLDSIRAREALEAEDLRELAKEDVKGIDAWSDGEIKRIKLERERRIASRREQLQVRLEEHRMVVASEVEAVEAALASYRIETERFFDRLGSETDPVEIARQAGTRPPFPALDQIGPQQEAPAIAAYQAPAAEAAASEAPAPMSAAAVIAGIQATQTPEPVETVASVEPAVSDDVAATAEAPETTDGPEPVEAIATVEAAASVEAAEAVDTTETAETTETETTEPQPEPVAAEAEHHVEEPFDEDQLIGVMDPAASPAAAESPWGSGVEAVDESAGIGAAVEAVQHAVEGAGEGGDGSEEPVPVGAEARVVMPRTTGGAGSWLRWPNSSVDRSDPSR